MAWQAAKPISAGGNLSGGSALRQAVEVVQGRHQRRNAWIGNPIEDRLCLATGDDKLLLPQFGKVLRDGRLAQPDAVHQGSGGQFLLGRKQAEDQQPVLICHRLKQVGHCGCIVRELLGTAFEFGFADHVFNITNVR